MPYIAYWNQPGYLPDGDSQLAMFDDAVDAWEYLANERRDALDAVEDYDPDDVEAMLRANARVAARVRDGSHQTGSVKGSTPGYRGDHDLGIVYEVTFAQEEDGRG